MNDFPKTWPAPHDPTILASLALSIAGCKEVIAGVGGFTTRANHKVTSRRADFTRGAGHRRPFARTSNRPSGGKFKRRAELVTVLVNTS